MNSKKASQLINSITSYFPFLVSFFAVENVDEISSFIEANKENEDVKKFIGGFYAPEKLNSFLDSPDGLKIIQPRLDKYHTRGLESWKANNLNSLIESEITKRNPALTEEQKRIKKLEDEIAAEKLANKRNSITQTLSAKLAEFKLPIKLAKYFVAEDEEASLANLTEFKTEIDALIENKIKDEFKIHGRTFKTPSSGTKNANQQMNSLIRSGAGQ